MLTQRLQKLIQKAHELDCQGDFVSADRITNQMVKLAVDATPTTTPVAPATPQTAQNQVYTNLDKFLVDKWNTNRESFAKHLQGVNQPNLAGYHGDRQTAINHLTQLGLDPTVAASFVNQYVAATPAPVAATPAAPVATSTQQATQQSTAVPTVQTPAPAAASTHNFQILDQPMPSVDQREYSSVPSNPIKRGPDGKPIQKYIETPKPDGTKTYKLNPHFFYQWNNYYKDWQPY